MKIRPKRTEGITKPPHPQKDPYVYTVHGHGGRQGGENWTQHTPASRFCHKNGRHAGPARQCLPKKISRSRTLFFCWTSARNQRWPMQQKGVAVSTHKHAQHLRVHTHRQNNVSLPYIGFAEKKHKHKKNKDGKKLAPFHPVGTVTLFRTTPTILDTHLELLSMT